MSAGDEAPAAPVLRVVRGDASPEDVAALLTVLSAVSGPVPARPRPRSHWGQRSRNVRPPAGPPGPDSWRASGLPR